MFIILIEMLTNVVSHRSLKLYYVFTVSHQNSVFSLVCEAKTRWRMWSMPHSIICKRYRNIPNIFSQDASLRSLDDYSDAKKPFLRCYDIVGYTEISWTIELLRTSCFKEQRETTSSIDPREVRQHLIIMKLYNKNLLFIQQVLQQKLYLPFLMTTQTLMKNSA